MIPRSPTGIETARAGTYHAPRQALGAKIRRWQPFRNPAGTILGYLDIELPSGMITNSCKLMVGQNGKPWVAMPSERQLDRDGNPRLDTNGKQLWTSIIGFASRAARDRFNELVLAALQHQHPDAPQLDASPHRPRAPDRAPGASDRVDDLWSEPVP